MTNISEEPTSKNHDMFIKLLDSSLRLLVIPLSIASLWIMVINTQVNEYGKLEFSNFTGFKYLVSISAISAGYALTAVVLSWFKWLISNWVLFVSDQVLAYLMMTSGSAVMELLYLAYNGDRGVTWSEACDSYGKFCSKVKVSLILHFLAFVCFLVLSVISAYRVFSKFGPPIPCNEDEQQQVE